MDLAITLDQRSATPLHKQLYDELRRAILTGRLKPGERVPSTRGLSQSLGVSRTTVTQSYEQLLSEGYLRASTGSGTFVGCELPDELLKTKPVEKSRPEARLPETGRQIELSRYGASIADSAPVRAARTRSADKFQNGSPRAGGISVAAMAAVDAQTLSRERSLAARLRRRIAGLQAAARGDSRLSQTCARRQMRRRSGGDRERGAAGARSDREASD